MNWHLSQIIARNFCALLREELGDDQVTGVVALNSVQTDPNICHSHDFCNANMVMQAAFTKTGRPLFNKDGVIDDTSQDLFNAAWSMAKDAGFVASKVQVPRYRIAPCECGGYAGKPCRDVFIEGMDMKSEGRFNREDAEKIVRILRSHDAVVHALTMVRDADNDCKTDGQPTIPGIARGTIDRALALAGVK